MMTAIYHDLLDHIEVQVHRKGQNAARLSSTTTSVLSCVEANLDSKLDNFSVFQVMLAVRVSDFCAMVKCSSVLSICICFALVYVSNANGL